MARRRTPRLWGALVALVVVASPSASSAEGGAPARVRVDRVVVRWHASETGGAGRPRFVMERELAFEARVEALADGSGGPAPYAPRQVRAALERQIGESMLASLPVAPRPTPAEVARRAEAARARMEQRVGGRGRLLSAARAEGIGADELDAILRRQARASLYLDRMVAPMLEPGEAELRAVWQAGASPFKHQPFDAVARDLERWYVSARLAQAIESYYESARSRLTVEIVAPEP